MIWIVDLIRGSSEAVDYESFPVAEPSPNSAELMAEPSPGPSLKGEEELEQRAFVVRSHHCAADERDRRAAVFQELVVEFFPGCFCRRAVAHQSSRSLRIMSLPSV